jgi:phospholipid/cholesterol/gamma-HCH transport system substrate-binding protein
MEDRVIQFRVGVLVVATCIIGGILIMLFGEAPLRNQYTIYVRFPQAPGVSVDTPVLKGGILIGRVTRITLLDDPRGGVVVTARIDGNRQLRNNEICRIRTGSILGDAVLEFVPSSAQPVVIETYEDGEYLDGIVAQDPLQVMESATTVLDMLSGLEQDVRLALASIDEAGKRVGTVADSLGAVVENNQDQFQRIMVKSERALDQFTRVAESINTLTGDEDFQVMIEQAFDVLPDLLLDAREVLSSFQAVAARADQNLANLEGLTEPLGERGEALATSLERTLTQVDTVLSQLVEFSQSINQREGTLGQLVHNRELYDRINRALMNIEYISARMRPIVDDARVFTDKIARDPGRLGVKGALDRSQSGTKR